VDSRRSGTRPCPGFEFPGGHFIDRREWRGLVADGGQELLDRPPVTFDLDEDPGTVVAHLPGQAQPHGERVHEGPEPDPLHHAGDPHRQPNSIIHPASVRRPDRRPEHHRWMIDAAGSGCRRCRCTW
jgi:hypothetical protein